MGSLQVMRSVSADFCASAGAAIASVMQAGRRAPRRQVSVRIQLVLLNSDTLDDIGNILRRKHTAPGIEATRMPTQWSWPLTCQPICARWAGATVLGHRR